MCITYSCAHTGGDGRRLYDDDWRRGGGGGGFGGTGGGWSWDQAAPQGDAVHAI
jgi:hypothetical protein